MKCILTCLVVTLGLGSVIFASHAYAGWEEEKFAAQKLYGTKDWSDKERTARLCRHARLDPPRNNLGGRDLDEALRRQCAEALQLAALKNIKAGNVAQANSDLDMAKRAGLPDEQFKKLKTQIASGTAASKAQSPVAAAAPDSDSSVFCLLTNKVAAAGQLGQYSDEQIRNGLCMTSKELMTAITQDNSFKQQVCTQAAGYMMQEFKGRFPSQDPKSVIGRC